ncbi:hypothetical protein [Ralstonia phage phiRSL1]|uniref:Uncharacterized protein n=1 Tax=Ralstonia phage phiRSL1 TaxID=1980924 RepID=B2ZY40_9CAUD|nr:hypothetical protein RSL1_ORF169 [Ralstonia phage phiRSL1]BAG41616.1 hypothetical protein [Ralstonia phage phiRSL1]
MQLKDFLKEKAQELEDFEFNYNRKKNTQYRPREQWEELLTEYLESHSATPPKDQEAA